MRTAYAKVKGLEKPIQSPSNISGRLWQKFSQSLTGNDRFSAYLEPVIQMLLPAWAANSYRAQVINRRIENEQAFTLVLRPSRYWPAFTAGQFVQITVEVDGALVSRVFSISSSPQMFQKEGLIELSIRIQEKGRITPWLAADLKIRQWIRLSAPSGVFSIENTIKSAAQKASLPLQKNSTQTDDDTNGSAQSRPLLFIAGGSGITPFRAMLHEYKETLQVTVIYSYRGAAQSLFLSELNQLKTTFPNIKIHLLDSSRQPRMNASRLLELAPEVFGSTILLCGPPAFMQHTVKEILSLGVSKDRILQESFSSTPINAISSHYASVALNGRSDLSQDNFLAPTDERKIHFLLSQKTMSINSNNNDPLLNLAESIGLKPVHGCRAGVCHQCICKKRQGRVLNMRTQQYSDTGPEDIQLCISVPVDNVALDL